jgi:hypothetical protein
LLFVPEVSEGPGVSGCAGEGKWPSSGIRAGVGVLFVQVTERSRYTMPPRRERQSPDPEDREVRRRGRPAGNPEMERQMQDLRSRMEEMETAQRRGAGTGEFSDYEVEEEAGHEAEEVSAEDASMERLIRAISRMSSKTKMEIPVYEGSLNAKELLDWI